MQFRPEDPFLWNLERILSYEVSTRGSSLRKLWADDPLCGNLRHREAVDTDVFGFCVYSTLVPWQAKNSVRPVLSLLGLEIPFKRGWFCTACHQSLPSSLDVTMEASLSMSFNCFSFNSFSRSHTSDVLRHVQQTSPCSNLSRERRPRDTTEPRGENCIALRCGERVQLHHELAAPGVYPRGPRASWIALHHWQQGLHASALRSVQRPWQCRRTPCEVTIHQL